MAKNYIAMAVNGKEFLYNPLTVIKCRSGKQAQEIADFLNKNNDSSSKDFRLKDGQVWHCFEDLEPFYRIRSTKGKISVVRL